MLRNKFIMNLNEPTIFKVVKLDNGDVYYWNWMRDYVNYKDVIPVAQKQLFEYWELVEGTRDWENWKEIIFLAEIPGAFNFKYLWIPIKSKDDFIEWENVLYYEYKNVRKLDPQAISKKDIMEKFWVREDFYLVE